MPDQLKNALIGIFALAGLAILGFIILFLHPQTGDERQTLIVRFADIDKITPGTRVNFAGKPVGEVAAIEEISSPRDQRIHGNLIYPYQLVLKIDSHIKVYNSDEISVHTSGLLGERSVAITPKHPKKGVELRQVTDKDILYAAEAISLEETFAEFHDFAQKAEAVIDGVLDQLQDIRRNKIWDNLGETTKNLADITSELNVPSNWKEMLANFTAFSGKINHAAENIVDISGRTVKGEGTLGRVIYRDDLYLQLKSVLSKGTTIMDDINHYGLLFQNDKGWQRLRARRMNLLQKLQNPAEFQNFFNDELDTISTSLARVSEVLNMTYCVCPPEDLLCDRDFESLFADLLRRVESLGENIKMYNQQLVSEHEQAGCCP